MKKYYNVDFIRLEKMGVSVIVEAESEEDAIQKVKSGDYMGQESLTDSDITDEYNFNASLDESGM